MINLLELNVCCDPEFIPFWSLVGTIVKVIWIGIPIIVIVLGMIDFAKATITNKEEESKKATKLFGKRVLYAVCAFLSVWIVSTVFSIVANIFADSPSFSYNESQWMACWELITTGSTNCNSENQGGSSGGGANNGESIYTVTFDASPGKVFYGRNGNQVTTYSVKTDSNGVVKLIDGSDSELNVYYQGHVLKGWTKTKGNCNGSAVINGTNLAVSSDTILYACYDFYKVTYDANGGKLRFDRSGQDIRDTYSLTVGESGLVNLISESQANLPYIIRSGYKFKGWSKIKDECSKNLYNGNIKITETMTLYACWEKQ